MEKLWAPWRMEYIKNKDKNRGGCVLCLKRLARGHSEQELVLYRSGLCYVVLNKYPYIGGHAMVVPNRHIAKLENLTSDEGLDIFLTIQKTIKVLKKAMKPDGINMGLNLGKAAGAGLTKHLHYHLVPRWNGDTNFMPVIGESKVISETLKASHNRLAPLFKK